VVDTHTTYVSIINISSNCLKCAVFLSNKLLNFFTYKIKIACFIVVAFSLYNRMFQIGKPCDDDFGQTTSVTLYGSDEAVAKAKHLIEDFLNNFSSKSNGSNCSGSEGTETAVVEPEPQKPMINWAEASRIFVSRK
jgi:hypothetical protein